MEYLNEDEDCTAKVVGSNIKFCSYEMDDIFGCSESQVSFDLLNLKTFIDKVIQEKLKG